MEHFQILPNSAQRLRVKASINPTNGPFWRNLSAPFLWLSWNPTTPPPPTRPLTLFSQPVSYLATEASQYQLIELVLCFEPGRPGARGANGFQLGLCVGIKSSSGKVAAKSNHLVRVVVVVCGGRAAGQQSVRLLLEETRPPEEEEEEESEGGGQGRLG